MNPISRRNALRLVLAGCSPMVPKLAAADPIRLVISESVVGDVNLNDARAATQVWVNRLARELDVVVDTKLFDSTQELQDRTRKGQLDAVALNVLEYRPIADLLDPSLIVTSGGSAGQEQYLLLTKRNSGIRQLGDLKGRRLCMLKNPKMCVAPAWLTAILEEGHYGPVEQFFASVTTASKFPLVVLPVFFGQAEACVTSRRSFETMSELNPQVGKDLEVLASSGPLVLMFYIFRKNYEQAQKERLTAAISKLRASAGGQELATLFQFDELTLRDGACLGNALRILEAADRARNRTAASVRKDKL
jgi:ABC-type phosphate/phosphonate transport system substrate-binding protein